MLMFESLPTFFAIVLVHKHSAFNGVTFKRIMREVHNGVTFSVTCSNCPQPAAQPAISTLARILLVAAHLWYSHSIQVRLPSNRAKLASREVDERMKSMRVTTVPQDFGLENEDWLVMPMQRCLETNCLKPRGIDAITCSAPINT